MFLVVLLLLTRGPKESLKEETDFFSLIWKICNSTSQIFPLSRESERNFWGLSEAHVWIDWSAPLDLTSCRGLVIEMASARRCDGERSLEKHWGLGYSVESKDWISTIEG